MLIQNAFSRVQQLNAFCIVAKARNVVRLELKGGAEAA